MSDLKLLWGQKTKQLLLEAGSLTYSTIKTSGAFVPLWRLLAKNRNIEILEFSQVLDNIFNSLYKHPLTIKSRKMTRYFRKNKIIPNEESTEKLIKYVVDQVVLRSPVQVPEVVVSEFWIFFRELFSEPELKGLVELNLDILRLVLKTYEPLLVEIINLLKKAKRINQTILSEILAKVNIIHQDMVIIHRQIKALRYLKPFFKTDPKDFKTQARIVASMVREFGPFFIKIAQVAAANAEFLPEEISKELMVFQEDVDPMKADEVREAFEECIGSHPHENYFDFDMHHPVKSGSIGSVYLAKKPVRMGGKEVLKPIIVKIGRKGLDREFLMGKTVVGLALLSSNYWAPHSKLAPFLQALTEQADEFVSGFERELDFEKEGRNQERFLKRSHLSTAWYVPEIYLITPRILEMEYIKGSVNAVNAIKSLPHNERTPFARQIGTRFLYTVLLQIFAYQEFHGDLHPGNVLINPKGKLYLIDYGNCVQMEGKWKPLWDYLAGALSANVEILSEALINISSNPEANRKRRTQIIGTLKQTLHKKKVKPLNRYFFLQLQIEGLQGLWRRLQVVLHLMSNTQHLGLVVTSEYLHFSRSLVAMVGTYLAFYENIPRIILFFDLFKTIGQFPLELVRYRLGVKRTEIYLRIINKLPLPGSIKKNWVQRV